MTARRRSAWAAAVAVAAAAAACGSGGRSASEGRAPTSSTTTAARGAPDPLGPCQPTPPDQHQAPPSWLPADLPLPGAYPVRPGPPEAGVETYVFVMPAAPDDFLRLTSSVWPTSGWRLHRPESEGFEAENRFTRAAAYGGFKIRAVYCDKGVSELTLAYSPGS